MGDIILGDNLDVLPTLPNGAFQLIYVDPPFNTGKSQSRTRIKVTPDSDGDRTGFQGRRYRTHVVGNSRYADDFDDYIGFPPSPHDRSLPRGWMTTAACSSTSTTGKSTIAR